MKDLVQGIAGALGYAIRKSDTLENLLESKDWLSKKVAALEDRLHASTSEIGMLRDRCRHLEEDAAQSKLALENAQQQISERDLKINRAQRYLNAAQYSDWAHSVFGRRIMPVTDTSVKGIAIFSDESLYSRAAGRTLGYIEEAYVIQLLQKIRDEKVTGQIAEFGVYQGKWLKLLMNMMSSIGLERELWGFDSFAGLSHPSKEYDDPFWKEGMFSAGLEEVRRNINADNHENIHLVPGWFSESLSTPKAQELKDISYARIDCDIYEPAVECLQFLGSRLSHGSVLVFDDWSHDISIGETRAFAEWIESVPHLDFEFLFMGVWDHFYMRVWHKAKPRPLGN
ncbi:TylF/MycF/NovP-related O-methyltransferase [Paraburkholderia silviterrae]|uniref:Macrocin-O-methyltransferase TylF n=1 Tax=Paraburkholderia silviterrae TaxID=2528715 RepID=A0A4R5LYK8_9BURK|nr:TylF/MycF/NovP-related O-methyltransferase [Paraburkholderia silviterrae]TDG17400.1 hypothetical protein EYW47_37785 [Paraburkholderia silviterrae]